MEQNLHLCLGIFFLSFAIISFGNCQNNNNLSTLDLVQILYRHGDRTPLGTFPTDKYANYWVIGPGQLTTIGKQQQYELGQFIRHRYDGFLNETYSYDEVTIRSTDVDRTLMSAESNLAGLYPPIGNEVWNPTIDWQPIPVHTVTDMFDFLLNTDSECPKYFEITAEVYASPEVQKINEEYQALYDFLTMETGVIISDISNASEIFDILWIDECHNLTLPSWANESVLSALKHLSDLNFMFTAVTQEQQRLRGGPLVKQMITNIIEKINGSINTQQALIYSAHDSTIAAFLSALGVFNDIAPPYASAVFVELHRQEDETYAVQFFYRNTTTVEPHELTIPNCTSPCPLGQLVSLTEPIIPVNIVKECELSLDAFADISTLKRERRSTLR